MTLVLASVRISFAPALIGRGSVTVAYVRKTVDVWALDVNYGQGWEHEITEPTLLEARERRKEYRENCSYPVRIRLMREKIKPNEVIKGSA
jgi:hypothetical protein